MTSQRHLVPRGYQFQGPRGRLSPAGIKHVTKYGGVPTWEGAEDRPPDYISERSRRQHHDRHLRTGKARISLAKVTLCSEPESEPDACI